jgi:hypothetical protein
MMKPVEKKGEDREEHNGLEPRLLVQEIPGQGEEKDGSHEPTEVGADPDAELRVAKEGRSRRDQPGHHGWVVQVAEGRMLGVVPVVGLFGHEVHHPEVGEAQQERVGCQPNGSRTPTQALIALPSPRKDKKQVAGVVDESRCSDGCHHRGQGRPTQIVVAQVQHASTQKEGHGRDGHKTEVAGTVKTSSATLPEGPAPVQGVVSQRGGQEARDVGEWEPETSRPEDLK